MAKYDGTVSIATLLDTKQLEKDLKYAQNELLKYDKEAQKLTEQKAKLNIDLSEYERQKELIKSSTDESLKFAQSEEQVKNVLDLENMELEELNTKYSDVITKIKEIDSQIDNNTNSQNILKQKIEETNNEIKKINGFKVLHSDIDKASSKMGKVLNSVKKWALAVVGVRSAYALVRRAISLVEGSNEGISSQIEVMKQAIANTLLPLIQKVLNFIAKIMVYINYIFKSFTGKNLFDFSKAFKDVSNNTNKTAKNLGESSKNAKELRKTLAGFDEMNILGDNTTSEGGIKGNAGANIPDVKLENPFKDWEKIEIPEWVDKIVEFGKFVVDNWQDVVGLLISTKAIFDILSGNVVLGIVEFVIFLLTQLPKLKDAIGEVFNFLKKVFLWVVDILADISQKVTEFIGNIITKIADFFVNLWNKAKDFFGNIIDGVSNVVSKIIDFFKNLPDWFSNNIIKPVGNFFSGMWDKMLTGAKNVWKNIKSVFSGFANFFGDIFSSAWQKVKNIFSKGGQVFDGLVEGISKVFKDVVNGVIKGINAVVAVPFQTINDVLNWIRNIDIPLIGKPFYGLWKQNVVPIPKIPLLASGGLVNNPGKGVPVGNALAGEAGVEGVVPLTNSQAMEQLGQAIGRYIVINANITNTMNGKIISRELQKINNSNDFAYNR